MRGDDQAPASIEVTLHQRSCGRIERRVLLQSDLPDHDPTGLQDSQGREPELRDSPHGPCPSVIAERGRVRGFPLGRERAPAHDEEDIADWRRLELIVGSVVRIRRRIREPSTGGDLEVVERLRAETRQCDRMCRL